MKYVATVNGREFEIEIDRDDEIVVDGQVMRVDFRVLGEGGVLSLLLDNRSVEGIVEARDEAWEVLLHGELYSVAVQDERSLRLARARGAAAGASGEAVVKSPMPGVILDVLVTPGTAVTKGDKVAILESMKMENELRAPRDGVVLRVAVEKGASVDKGQLLLVIGDAGGEEK